MWKLLRYLKGYRKQAVLGPFFKLLEASFELIVPFVIAAIVDQGIAGADKGFVYRMCAILVTLGVVGLVCSITAQYFAAKAAVGFASQIRRSLFGHIQTFSYGQLDHLGTARLMTHMTSDINQVQTGMNLTLRLLLRSPFVVFGALIMALMIDVRAAMLFAVTIPLLGLVVLLVMLFSIRLYNRAQSTLDGVMGFARENLSGARVLRAFGKEEEEIEIFSRQTEALASIQRRVGRISALMNPLTYVIVNLAIVGLVRTGALRVEAGILTQGSVIALYNLMSQILVELIKTANMIVNLAKAIACGNRIQSVFETKAGQSAPSAPVRPPDTAPAVAFKEVSLHYPGAAADALSRISFTARRGDTIGIIGGTGSGKTALVNLLPRFYDATQGSVQINGVDVGEYPLEQLRQIFGIVPQQARLFRGTLRDNLRWGNEAATDAQLMKALAIAQAMDVFSRLEGGLDGLIEQGGGNLSGGQKQRLTIARALVRQPDILILDDSASALDYATDAALRSALSKLEGTTVFIVSQRASSLMHANCILVLENGKLLDSGTHDQLLERCPLYQEIYRTQFAGEGQGA